MQQPVARLGHREPLRGQRGRWEFRVGGMLFQVDPDADGEPRRIGAALAGGLEQYARDLGAVHEHVVRPFDLGVRAERRHRIAGGERRGKRELRAFAGGLARRKRSVAERLPSGDTQLRPRPAAAAV